MVTDNTVRQRAHEREGQSESREGVSLMKVVIALLIVALGIAVANTALAQQVSVGVIGGVNSATIDFSEEQEFDVNQNIGFNVGGLVALNFSEQWAVQLEALYTQKGAGAEAVGTDGTFNFSYLEFPLLAKVAFPIQASDRTSLHLFAGPTVAFELSCRVSGQIAGVPIDEDCDSPEVEILRKKTDYGVLFGGGIGIGAGPGAITLDVAYDLGLRNLNDDPEAPDTSAKGRTLMLQAGYIVPLGG